VCADHRLACLRELAGRRFRLRDCRVLVPVLARLLTRTERCPPGFETPAFGPHGGFGGHYLHVGVAPLQLVDETVVFQRRGVPFDHDRVVPLGSEAIFIMSRIECECEYGATAVTSAEEE
jgi:hypothetical protein